MEHSALEHVRVTARLIDSAELKEIAPCAIPAHRLENWNVSVRSHAHEFRVVYDSLQLAAFLGVRLTNEMPLHEGRGLALAHRAIFVQRKSFVVNWPLV